MNAVVEIDDVKDFFAPAPTDLIDSLLGRYNFDKKRIEEVAVFAAGDACRNVLHYFMNGNATDDRGRLSMEMSANQLFNIDGAVAQLNATYWQEALNLTDVYNAMPQERRNKWNEQIRNPKGTKKHRDSKEWVIPPLPAFEEASVRATLQDLLASRTLFMAERVDGIFRALSGEHVTNSPAGFSKRMIIAYLFNSWDSVQHDRCGYINDLRCVIAKFMGRDEPSWNSTSSVVEGARKYKRGEWVTLDGGALRLRAYKCGTAHLEVHRDIAWRLNQILAHLHPAAIPAEFRQKPKKKSKEFQMMGRPLPFKVLEALSDLITAFTLEKTTGENSWRRDYDRIEIKNALEFRYGFNFDESVKKEAERVLEYIGAVKVSHKNNFLYQFDYDPKNVLSEIKFTGCLPDQKAHQYYPTPESVAQRAIELAEIGATDKCLEPSAGTGHIADLLPKGRTFCVEISALHSEVLRAKGHQVSTMDFMQFINGTYDRIVMNPPYSEGRWQAHVEHASTLLHPNGILVAVLPSSARNKYKLNGFDLTFSEVFENEFSGTSVSVVILKAMKCKP